MKKIATWVWENTSQSKEDWEMYSSAYPNMEVVSLIPDKSEKIKQ